MIEFLYLLIIYSCIGYPFYKIFSEFLNPQIKIFKFFVLIFWGLTMSSLLQLFLYYLSIRIDSKFIFPSTLIILFFFILYFFSRKNLKVKNYLSFEIKDKIPFILLNGFILFLFLFLLFFAESLIFLNQDHLSFWLLDPKIIFETGIIRQDTDAINSLIDNYAYYGSFLSIPRFDLYSLIGSVDEKTCSYFTVLFAFIGLAAISGFYSKFKSNAYSTSEFYGNIIIFGAFIILITSLATNTNKSLIFGAYAEVPTALYLFFIVILSFGFNKIPKLKKFTLFLLFSFIFINIKFAHLSYFYILSSLVLINMSFSFIKNFIRTKRIEKVNLDLKTQLPIIILLLFTVIMYFLNQVYFEKLSSSQVYIDITYKKQVIERGFSIIFEKISQNPFKSISELLILFATRLNEVLSYYSLLSYSILIGLILFIFKPNLNLLKPIVVLLFFILIPIIGYSVTGKSMNSGSLYRYTTIGFFVLPLIYCAFDFNSKSKLYKIFVSLFLVLSLFFFSDKIYEVSQSENFYFRQGSLLKIDRFRRLSKLSNKIKSKLNETDNLMLVTVRSNSEFRSKSIDASSIIYNLHDNMVCPIYKTNKVTSFEKFLFDCNPDYLLIMNKKGKYKKILNQISKTLKTKIPNTKYILLKKQENGFKVIPI